MSVILNTHQDISKQNAVQNEYADYCSSPCSVSYSASWTSTDQGFTDTHTHRRNIISHQQVSWDKIVDHQDIVVTLLLSGMSTQKKTYIQGKTCWIFSICPSTAVEYAIQFSSSANGVINSATFKALNADTTIPRTVRIWPGNSQVASPLTNYYCSKWSVDCWSYHSIIRYYWFNIYYIRIFIRLILPILLDLLLFQEILFLFQKIFFFFQEHIKVMLEVKWQILMLILFLIVVLKNKNSDSFN